MLERLSFMHINVEKYGLAALIRIASSPFGVFHENDWRAPTGFRIPDYRNKEFRCYPPC